MGFQDVDGVGAALKGRQMESPLAGDGEQVVKANFDLTSLVTM